MSSSVAALLAERAAGLSAGGGRSRSTPSVAEFVGEELPFVCAEIAQRCGAPCAARRRRAPSRTSRWWTSATSLGPASSSDARDDDRRGASRRDVRRSRRCQAASTRARQLVPPRPRWPPRLHRRGGGWLPAVVSDADEGQRGRGPRPRAAGARPQLRGSPRAARRSCGRPSTWTTGARWTCRCACRSTSAAPRRSGCSPARGSSPCLRPMGSATRSSTSALTPGRPQARRARADLGDAARRGRPPPLPPVRVRPRGSSTNAPATPSERSAAALLHPQRRLVAGTAHRRMDASTPSSRRTRVDPRRPPPRLLRVGRQALRPGGPRAGRSGHRTRGAARSRRDGPRGRAWLPSPRSGAKGPSRGARARRARPRRTPGTRACPGPRPSLWSTTSQDSPHARSADLDDPAARARRPGVPA